MNPAEILSRAGRRRGRRARHMPGAQGAERAQAWTWEPKEDGADHG